LSRAQRLIASGQFWAQALGQGSPAVREHGNENRDGVLDGAQVLDQLDALIEQRADASRQAKAAEEEQATKHSAEQAQVSTEAPSEPSMMEEEVPSDSGDAGNTGDTGYAGDEMPAVDAAVDDGEAAGQGLGGDTADSLTLEGVEAGAVAAAPDARSATKTSVAAGVPLPGSHTAGGVSPLWAMGAYAFAPIVREEYKPEQQSFSAIKKGYILYTWSQGLEQSKIPYWIISDSMMNDPMIGLMLAMQLPFFAALKTSFESKFYAHMAVERVMQAMGLMEPNLILRFSRVRNPVHRWNNYW